MMEVIVFLIWLPFFLTAGFLMIDLKRCGNYLKRLMKNKGTNEK